MNKNHFLYFVFSKYFSAAFVAVGLIIVSGYIIGQSNQPPQLDHLSGPLTLTCSQAGTWNVGASDSDDTNMTYTVNWGDGSANSTASVTGAVGTIISRDFSHT
ncbi:hypothetical protein KKC17_00005, partial [Patescibacteria group bacterium]|nr:hypothetical protein [Patescibacteria group bacterium]